MNTYNRTLKRARRFKVADLAALMPVSRRTIYALFNGESKNPRIDTVVALEKAVTKLEAAAAKMKPSQKAAKKQTASRDKRAAAVTSSKA